MAKTKLKKDGVAKVKKTIQLSFDYNGETITIDCLGGKSKKIRVEFMELINSKTQLPIFTNINATPVDVKPV